MIYLLSGQGSDERIFKNLQIDSSYSLHFIEYTVPDEGMDMAAYALELANQIDTSQSFILIGVSLGGMLAVEMNEFIKPDITMLLSSAKTINELPFRYRFQKTIPIYTLVPAWLSKKGAQILQPLVEPDRNKEKETCKAMLKAKDPIFLQRTIRMIIQWEKENYQGNIISIHGDKDHTIPIRNVSSDYLIKEGSHMMTLTRGVEVSKLINQILWINFKLY